MLTETINQIREMSHKGASIRGIAEKLSISTWSVQRHLKTDPKKPVTVVSPEGIESLESIIDKLSKRVEALEIFKQNTEQHDNNTITIQPTQSNTTNTEQHDNNTEQHKTNTANTELKKVDTYDKHTIQELAIITGKSERRIRDICKELAGKNMGIDKPGRPYRITAEGIKAIENVIKTSGRAKKNMKQKVRC